MTAVISYYATKRSLAASAELTEAEIKKQRWRKHIAEISKHLSTEPVQSEELTFEQQEEADLPHAAGRAGLVGRLC